MLVKAGDKVAVGDLLMVMIAMKMEVMVSSLLYRACLESKIEIVQYRFFFKLTFNNYLRILCHCRVSVL